MLKSFTLFNVQRLGPHRAKAQVTTVTDFLEIRTGDLCVQSKNGLMLLVTGKGGRRGQHIYFSILRKRRSWWERLRERFDPFYKAPESELPEEYSDIFIVAQSRREKAHA